MSANELEDVFGEHAVAAPAKGIWTSNHRLATLHPIPRLISGNQKGVYWVHARNVFSKCNRNTAICKRISTWLSWDRKQVDISTICMRTEITRLSLSSIRLSSTFCVFCITQHSNLGSVIHTLELCFTKFYRSREEQAQLKLQRHFTHKAPDI